MDILQAKKKALRQGSAVDVLDIPDPAVRDALMEMADDIVMIDNEFARHAAALALLLSVHDAVATGKGKSLLAHGTAVNVVMTRLTEKGLVDLRRVRSMKGGKRLDRELAGIRLIWRRTIEIAVENAFDPEGRGSVGRVVLASSICRPGRQMKRDATETIIEAAELLQEHAPFTEGQITRCADLIGAQIEACGEEGVATHMLEHGATLEVRVGRRMAMAA